MWTCVGQTIQMVEGDYGLELPISIGGVTFTERDSVTVKIAKGDNVIIEKTYGNITNNTVTLALSEEESALLPVGSYCYGLDWYQSGAFMCNIVQRNGFKVVDKL